MESYSVKNIKSFEELTTIELKPITIFVGKNSCGKSSLLRFPAVLSQTFSADTTSPLKFYGKLIDYGNYEDVVFKNKKEPIEFSLKYKVNINRDPLLLSRSVEKTAPIVRDVMVRTVLSKIKKKVIIMSNEMYIDGVLSYALYRDKNGKYNVKVFQLHDDENDEFSAAEYEVLLRSTGFEQFFVEIDLRNICNEIIKKYFPDGFPELEKSPEGKDGFSYMDVLTMPRAMYQYFLRSNDKGILDSDNISELKRIVRTYTYYSHMLTAICDVCKYEMSLLSYIGPFRMNPERVYRDEEFQTRRVGVKGENVSTVLIRDFQKKKELVSKISEWLKKTMGYQLIVEELSNGLYSILLEDDNGIKSNLIDVGYGISQILPIIAQILVDAPKQREFRSFVANIDNMIIVEQPELHLHPAAQSELAELFVSGVIDGKKKMVIETHSEHLIRKLQVLIADPNVNISNNDIAFYYVDKNVDGSAHVRELKVLPNGKFAEKWPSGFFDKAHELSMELLRNSTF